MRPNIYFFLKSIPHNLVSVSAKGTGITHFNMNQLEWKYIAITAGIALAVVILYDRVLKDYIPGSKTETV